jgi:hypothetical protein
MGKSVVWMGNQGFCLLKQGNSNYNDNGCGTGSSSAHNSIEYNTNPFIILRSIAFTISHHSRIIFRVSYIMLPTIARIAFPHGL